MVHDRLDPIDPAPSRSCLVAAVGDTDTAAWRGVVLLDGELGLELAPRVTLRSGIQVQPGHWHHIAATYDGTTARLYLDGRECGALEAATLQAVPRIDIAPTPRDPVPGGPPHFGGSLAGFTLEPYALEVRAVRLLADARPDFPLITFDHLGVGWPLQEHAWRGLQAPQEPVDAAEEPKRTERPSRRARGAERTGRARRGGARRVGTRYVVPARRTGGGGRWSDAVATRLSRRAMACRGGASARCSPR